MTADELGNNFGYRCPTCNRGDQLSIAAQTWIDMTPNGTTPSEEMGDHEWDGNSLVVCDCGWSGTAGQLEDTAIELVEG